MRTDILYDDGKVTHACEGDRMVPFDPGTFLVWTKCGRDVPANQGYVGVHSTATCPECTANNSDLGR